MESKKAPSKQTHRAVHQKALGWLGAFIAGAYIYDVIWRPQAIAKRARAVARELGKPLLNVGCGTKKSSFRALLMGPQLVGDVNLDLEAPQTVDPEYGYGDIHQIPYPDKFFGAALASHVLEHVDNPQQALSELHRVADKVFLVVPRWWAPHTWLHPGHQWYIPSDLSSFHPLWR